MDFVSPETYEFLYFLSHIMPASLSSYEGVWLVIPTPQGPLQWCLDPEELDAFEHVPREVYPVDTLSTEALTSIRLRALGPVFGAKLRLNEDTARRYDASYAKPIIGNSADVVVLDTEAQLELDFDRE